MAANYSDDQLTTMLLSDSGAQGPEDFCDVYFNAGTCPCICRLCGEVGDAEPDACAAYCEDCEDQTMVSGFVLLGVI